MAIEGHSSSRPPTDEARQILDRQTLMILVAAPSEETTACGGIIAHCCRRGRPPYVVIFTQGLDDADSPAPLDGPRESAARHAAEQLGLPEDRLFVARVPETRIPADGPGLESIVQAVTLESWRHDCSTICAPWQQGATADQKAVFDVANEVSHRNAIGLLAYVPGSGALLMEGRAGPAWRSLRLNVTSERARIERAMAVHGLTPLSVPDYWEFLEARTSVPASATFRGV